MQGEQNLYITFDDLAEVTGADEDYLQRLIDRHRLDTDTMRLVSETDGRVIIQDDNGDNFMLYGIDSGVRGRSVYWSSFENVTRLVKYRSDYPEIAGYGASIYFPRVY